MVQVLLRTALAFPALVAEMALYSLDAVVANSRSPSRARLSLRRTTVARSKSVWTASRAFPSTGPGGIRLSTGRNCDGLLAGTQSGFALKRAQCV